MRYMSFPLAFIVLLFLALGCSTSRKASDNLVGTYYGFLPCADCPGISYTLELKPNDQFEITRDYYERDNSSTAEGQYDYLNGTIILYSKGEVLEQYQKDGKNLILLDSDGNKIKTNLSPYYTLYKDKPSHLNVPDKFQSNKPSIVYKGTGNEPFWSIKIASDHTIKFEGLISGKKEFEVPVSNTSLSTDNQYIVYKGEDQSHTLNVHIINEPCLDGMSGHHNHTTLEVELNIDGQNQKLKGCGNFQNKYRLNGIWHLETINNNGIKAPSTPSLGIYLPDGRIAGNAGCNRFFGSLGGHSDKTVEFEQVGSTKMMCSDMIVEHHFLRLLRQDDIKWKVDDTGRLHLSSSNEGNFVFSRGVEL